jgi:hypothetical protein
MTSPSQAGIISNLRHVELLLDESWRNDCIGRNASRSFEGESNAQTLLCYGVRLSEPPRRLVPLQLLFKST